MGMTEQKSTVFQRFVETGWDEDDNGCWIWRGSKANKRGGYGQLSNGRGKVLKTHRISYEYFKGRIPRKSLIRHICDNPPCVNPDHLLLGNHKDNSNDAISRGRANHQVMSGEFCPASKLSWEQVLEIRKSEKSLSKLAKQYNISKTSIANIKKNKTWKDRGDVKTKQI